MNATNTAIFPCSISQCPLQNRTVQLTPLTPQEVATLQALARETFIQAFGSFQDPADLQTFLDTHYSQDKLYQELTDPEIGYWWISPKADSPKPVSPLGFVMVHHVPPQLTRALKDWPAQRPLQLQRIYIKPEAQQLGLGRSTLDLIIETSTQWGYDGLWLGVWKENHRAIQLYEQKGFQKMGEKHFIVGDTINEDWCMGRIL